jgi:two-component system chemotaxis response regulator CheB
MRKIRVLIVDDSVVVRRLVADALGEAADIEVVATAPNGSIALAKLPHVNPDLVTLDVEMPGMNGLETLAAIRKVYPRLPVIMFSTLTERGAATTLNALALGASDYVTKPANMGSIAASMQRVREDLIPKIRALCGVRTGSTAPPGAASKLPVSRGSIAQERRRVDVLAIGASTGGPNALSVLLPQLPGDLPVPVLIVQHMPPLFTKLLAERLSAHSHFRVREASAGETLQPGVAWIAPGDHHMEVQRAGAAIRVRIHQGPHENSCRPAVDPLFRSVADVFGCHALAIVLTGMGQDGLRGCEAIHDAGGQIVVQDEATSVVWGMPGAVAQAGLADSVLPLDQLPAELRRRLAVDRPALHGVRRVPGATSATS